MVIEDGWNLLVGTPSPEAKLLWDFEICLFGAVAIKFQDGRRQEGYDIALKHAVAQPVCPRKTIEGASGRRVNYNALEYFPALPLVCGNPHDPSRAIIT
mmetsp:Transcript_20088/g.41829  ORF Transcript_20088/g.41829 Transcript_20088/m.41829 type:complete len:99 (-) Transcript_20088:360-656(-)